MLHDTFGSLDAILRGSNILLSRLADVASTLCGAGLQLYYQVAVLGSVTLWFTYKSLQIIRGFGHPTFYGILSCSDRTRRRFSAVTYVSWAWRTVTESKSLFCAGHYAIVCRAVHSFQ